MNFQRVKGGQTHPRKNLGRMPTIKGRVSWAERLDWEGVNDAIKAAKTPEETFERGLAMVARLADQVTLQTEPSCPVVAYEDIFQAGTVGLLEACRRFDPRHTSQASSSTFAYYHVRGAMLDEAEGEHFVYITPKKRKLLKELTKRGHLGAKNAMEHPRSLQEIVSSSDLETGRDTRLEDTSPDPSPGPGELAAKEVRIQRLMECFESLGAREKEVITQRFGLGGIQEKTLGEIGEELGITKERVRQIQHGAFNKLRRKIHQREPERLARPAGAKKKEDSPTKKVPETKDRESGVCREYIAVISEAGMSSLSLRFNHPSPKNRGGKKPTMFSRDALAGLLRAHLKKDVLYADIGPKTKTMTLEEVLEKWDDEKGRILNIPGNEIRYVVNAERLEWDYLPSSVNVQISKGP